MIAVRCSSCGEPHKLRDELAGKKIRCKKCEEVVSVPGSTSSRSSAKSASGRKASVAASDDDDFDFDEAEFAAPVVRKSVKAKPRRRSSASENAADAAAVLWWIAIPFRIIGVFSVLIYVLGLAACLMTLHFIGVVVYGVPLVMSVLGLKGAAGKGIPIGSDNRLEGIAGIITGMTLIFISNPVVIVLLFAKAAGVNFGWGNGPVANVPQPVQQQVIQQPVNPLPRGANSIPNNSGVNATPQVPLNGANVPNNPPRTVAGAGAPNAPRPGQRVVVLRFQSYAGADGAVLDAAANALRTVPWAAPQSLAVSFPAKSIVCGIQGGSVNTGEATSALEKAGFRMAPGVQMTNFSDALLAAAPSPADLPGFGTANDAAVSAPNQPKTSSSGAPRTGTASDTRPLTLRKKYAVPVADRGARLVVPDLPSSVVMFDGSVYDTKAGDRLGRFSDLVRARNGGRLDALSSDGRYFARVDPRDQNTIEVFERDVEGPPRVIAFDKYKQPNIRFLTFVAPDRMLAGVRTSPDIQAVNIRLPEGRLGSDFKVDHAEQRGITVSSDGKYIALASATRFEVYDIAKGSRVAFMSPSPTLQGLPFASCDGVAFSPDSTEIAALFRGQQIVIWSQRGKVIDEATIRFQPSSAREGRQSFAWLPDKSGWILGGQLIIDRELKVPIAEFKPKLGESGGTGVLIDQETFVLPYEPNSKAELAAFEIPWKELQDRIAEVNSDSTALLRPGLSLSLQVDVGALRFAEVAATRTALEAAWTKRLSAMQLKVADGQPVTLRIAYSESAGKVGRVTTTARVATPPMLADTEGRMELSLVVRQSEPPCWSQKTQSTSGMFLSEEPTEANLRQQTFQSVLNSIERLTPPCNIDKDGKTTGLPILLQP